MKKLIILGLALTTSMGGGAFAHDTKSTWRLTRQQRDQMASLHEEMAKCLRSDKPLSECRSEMRKNCQAKMGNEGCPMMDHRHGSRGGMMGG